MTTIICSGKTVELELVDIGRRPIVEPARCPSCGSVTSRELRGKKGAATFCSNKQCSAALFAKVDHWIGGSKRGVGILDIGDTFLKAMWDNGLVSDPADLYTLTVEQLQDLKTEAGVRIGKSRAEKIVANIQGKKRLSLAFFLGSLGIDLLGRRRVQLLKEAAGGALDKLDDWLDDKKLASLNFPGFGDTIKASVRAGIDEYRDLIAKLLRNGVEIDYGDKKMTTKEIAVGESKPFESIEFVFTGTRDLVEETEAAGGIIKSGISKSVDYLVQKDPTSHSNKTKKADEYGVQVISIDYLRRALAGEVKLEKRKQDT